MLFPDLICQKCSETLNSFMILMWNRALATISRTFCQVLRTRQCFFSFFNVKSSSRYSLVQILPTLFFDIFKCKPSSRYSRVHFLSITFADRGPQPRKQRPYFGDPKSHITQKNTGFHARECFHPWIHTLRNCYTSQLLDDGWLTWWCGWHDGVNANHGHRP
jgi:hypothetical protein